MHFWVVHRSVEINQPSIESSRQIVLEMIVVQWCGSFHHAVPVG
jgi:hypothetical protein